jgi:hypothetical protein
VQWRLRALEAAQLPAPAAWLAERATGATAAFAAAGAAQRAAAGEALEAALHALRAELHRTVEACTDRAALEAARPALAALLQTGASAAVDAASTAGMGPAEAALSAAVAAARADLQARFQLPEGGEVPVLTHPDAAGHALAPRWGAEAEAELGAALAQLDQTRRRAELGGAAAGLVLGVALTGGLALPALLAGGAAMAAARIFGGPDRQRRELSERIDQTIEGLRPQLLEATLGALPDENALQAAFSQQLQAMVTVHDRWLQAAIDREATERVRLREAQARLEREAAELRRLGESLERALTDATGAPGVLPPATLGRWASAVGGPGGPAPRG